MATSFQSYMQRLDPKERDALLKLARKEADQERNLADSAGLTNEELEVEQKWNENSRYLATEHQEAIAELKARLKEENEMNQGLAASLREAKEMQDQMIGEYEEQIEELNEKINNMSEHIDKITKENLALKREVSYNQRTNHESQGKAGDLEKNMGNLRDLVINLVSENNKSKKREVWEKNFWQSINAHQLLFDSEPPEDYPIQKLSNPVPCTMDEWNRVNIQNRKLTEELKNLQKRLDQAENHRDDLFRNRNDLSREATSENTKLKKQLLGSVRRIQYLVEEKQRLQDEVTKNTKYSNKLEMTLVQYNLEIQTLKKTISRLKESKTLATSQFNPRQSQSSSAGGASGSYAASKRASMVSPKVVKARESLDDLDYQIAQQQVDNTHTKNVQRATQRHQSDDPRRQVIAEDRRESEDLDQQLGEFNQFLNDMEQNPDDFSEDRMQAMEKMMHQKKMNVAELDGGDYSSPEREEGKLAEIEETSEDTARYGGTSRSKKSTRRREMDDMIGHSPQRDDELMEQLQRKQYQMYK